jgi:hypothetical protein
MNSDNIEEQRGPKPVIARRKGELGAVMIDPKTGKPIPDTWIPKEEVPQTALKYLDPAKFSAAEKRNKDRQAQIEAEKQRLKGVGSTPSSPSTSSSPPSTPPPSTPPSSRSTPTPVSQTSSTAEKIKGGLEVYKKQVKSGDVKGAEATGKSTWALANPKLAAAADERARIRGTAQSDNPLLDKMGLRSRMQLTPTVQSPSLKKDLGNLAGNYTRLTQNPNAGISPTSKPPTTSTTSKPTTPVSTTPTTSNKPNPYGTTMGAGPTYKGGPVPPPIKDKVKKEAYDIVLDYLLSEGHADTLSEAHYVMMQMSADHIQDIVEFE